MAREVTVDETGLASGVSYIDKTTGRENHVRGRIVVLAASACESARLLLNSKSSRFPQGLGNSSGVVGKYLTDTTGTSVRGFIPKMMNSVPHNEDGASGSHLYMPWWGDNKKLDFPRGYHIELGGGRRMPGFGTLGGVHLYHSTAGDGGLVSSGGYGKQLKDDYRRFYGVHGGLRGTRRDDPQRKLGTARSIRRWWIAGAFRCCASTGNGRTTSSSRSSTCRKPSAPSSIRWAGRR